MLQIIINRNQYSLINLVEALGIQSIGALPQLFVVGPVIVMMSVSTNSCDRVIGGNVVLPTPFHKLSSIYDHRAKGSWIMVNLLSDWEVCVLKCHPGIRIVATATYKAHDSITFIHCPNVTKKSSCYIAIGMYKDTLSCVNAFSALDNGIITRSTFLCIVQGIFVSPSGKLCYIYHCLRRSSVIGSTISSLMTKYNEDPQTFCKIASANTPTTALDSLVSFLYLNQIAGPTMSSWSMSSNINIESGTPFIKASLQPDSWCLTWLSNDSQLRKCIKSEKLEEVNWKCQLKQKQGKE